MTRKPKTPPELPPKTQAELAAERELTRQMKELTAQLHQRNLNNAVLLAQQAAAGRGPLIEHFSELGRRYAGQLDAPQKPKLKMIK